MNETFNSIKHLVVDNKAGILPYGPPFNVMLSFTIMTTFKRNKYFLLFTKSLIYYLSVPLTQLMYAEVTPVIEVVDFQQFLSSGKY